MRFRSWAKAWTCTLIFCSALVLFHSSSQSAQELDLVESNFLVLINEHRAESEQCWNGAVWRDWAAHETRNLVHSASLARASENHNLTMIESDCFEHQCPGEATLPDRVTAAGYPRTWTLLLENLAAGQVLDTAQAAFNGWENSTGHNQAMLNCKMKAIGIARSYSDQSQYGWYWTTDFGDAIEE